MLESIYRSVTAVATVLIILYMSIMFFADGSIVQMAVAAMFMLALVYLTISGVVFIFMEYKPTEMSFAFRYTYWAGAGFITFLLFGFVLGFLSVLIKGSLL